MLHDISVSLIFVDDDDSGFEKTHIIQTSAMSFSCAYLSPRRTSGLLIVQRGRKPQKKPKHGQILALQ